MSLIEELGKNSKSAARILRNTTTADKNRALLLTAEEINKNKAAILLANKQDLQAADGEISHALLERLELTEKRINSMIDGLMQIAALPDPVGEITGIKTTAKGLKIGRMRAPIGTIAMIYESRPNVTIDAAGLCLKSGNAVILRGGREAMNSNLALLSCMQNALKIANIPEHAVQLIKNPDRKIVSEMLAAREYIDVLIPRGGKGLVELVAREATMPTIKHLEGICHIFVDKYADLDKALNICDNAKTYRYGICGAMETLLIHREIADEFLPKIAAIYRQKAVEIRGCAKTCKILSDLGIESVAATEEDWSTEYLAAVISIKIVDDFNTAVGHIETYSSGHTDAIITENLTAANQFLQEVNSASVMINTPTCFADGYEYGLGAEIGISTDKIHWRGPVALEGLTCEKFIVMSDGIIRK
ncbi:MAG: glutamate-5-semialdehyde dehydrogenase [Cardiobacteriaceae bacterium]|nr:glutamate-5-semialdehyde dehydrogenase [Cardiobacteriaceae bacterium]